ncbi:hypothetical protein DFH06DRAFT_1321206 [Mycena polygramma]|nr:hypothetical protein DFH06DRAFT_1331411 [Mycena polygramma]KAJ7669180.1 hypothetical protein DFH06DRAFT_1321206 [Mycena polygramma]
MQGKYHPSNFLRPLTGIYVSSASPPLLRPALLSELPEKAVSIANGNSLTSFLDLSPSKRKLVASTAVTANSDHLPRS